MSCITRKLPPCFRNAISISSTASEITRGCFQSHLLQVDSLACVPEHLTSHICFASYTNTSLAQARRRFPRSFIQARHLFMLLATGGELPRIPLAKMALSILFPSRGQRSSSPIPVSAAILASHQRTGKSSERFKSGHHVSLGERPKVFKWLLGSVYCCPPAPASCRPENNPVFVYTCKRYKFPNETSMAPRQTGRTSDPGLHEQLTFFCKREDTEDHVSLDEIARDPWEW